MHHSSDSNFETTLDQHSQPEVPIDDARALSMIAANTTRLLFAWQEADQKEHEEEKDRDDNDIRSHVDKGVIGLVPCFNEVVPLL